MDNFIIFGLGNAGTEVVSRLIKRIKLCDNDKLTKAIHCFAIDLKPFDDIKLSQIPESNYIDISCDDPKTILKKFLGNKIFSSWVYNEKEFNIEKTENIKQEKSNTIYNYRIFNKMLLLESISAGKFEILKSFITTFNFSENTNVILIFSLFENPGNSIFLDFGYDFSTNS